MTNQKVIVNGNYKHEKRGNNYHVLLTANDASKNPNYPVKVVYVDSENQVWCKNVDRFLAGMTLMDNGDKTFLFKHNPNERYPQPTEKFQHHNGNIYSVLYIANSHCDAEDYPIFVIYQNENNGTIWAKTLENFHEKMTKI